jgi:hypothetical protein
VSFTTIVFIHPIKGGNLMEFVARYHLRPGKERDARKWILEKEKEGIPDAPGWKYLGTYFNSMGFGRFDMEIRSEIENYAAIDAWREDPEAQWLKFADGFFQFIDLSRPYEMAILREASEHSSMN